VTRLHSLNKPIPVKLLSTVLSVDKAYVRSGVVQKETSAAISALGLALLEAALAHQGRLLVTQYLERTIMSK
jgi:hypothetical protein